jgi:SdrD B-like protein
LRDYDDPGGRSVTGRLGPRLAALIATITLSFTFPAGSAVADPETPTVSADPSAPPSVDPSSPPAQPPPPPSSESPAPPSEPVQPKAADEQFDVSVAFDKPSYNTGDQVWFTFTVKNLGSAPVSGVQATDIGGTASNFDLDYPYGWGDLDPRGKGATLEPGGTVSAHLSGRQRNPETGVNFKGYVSMLAGPAYQEFTLPFPITETFGHLGGLAFGDADNNGKADPGEELANVKLTWTYSSGANIEYSTTTDAHGRFDMPKVPTGRYSGSGTAPDGWRVGFRQITVDQSDDHADMRIRLVKPLAPGQLTAGLKFTKDTYLAGELAHLTVTLSNKGSSPLVGIVANCNRVGDSYGLNGMDEGWGALAKGGVDIAAGATKVLDVTEKVPAAALTFGRVEISCDFGFEGVDDVENSPNPRDSANVPGGLGGIRGTIGYWSSGQGSGRPEKFIQGTRVVLAGNGPCPILAETTTDMFGYFEFTGLIAARYSVYFVLPAGWKHLYSEGTDHHDGTDHDVQVEDGHLNDFSVMVVPGQDTSSPPPAQPAECTPVTPDPPAEVISVTHAGLAHTGSDVIDMAGLGVIALLFGASVVAATRRRSSAN